MRFQSHAVAILAVVTKTTIAYTPASTLKTDLLAGSALVNLALHETTQILNGTQGSCHLSNASVRREWSTLSNQEREDYNNAVLCLMSKPSQLDSAEVPGAKTRYDDYVAVHINQTLTIHGTTSFLSWHRYFIHNFEQDLKNLCGFQGSLPYWNWGKTAEDPVNSPMFDGSAYSVGGNGVYEEHNCTEALPTNLNCIPPGEGGGCVETGPYKGMTVNLGPVSPTLAEAEVVASSSMFAYNPRCLKRDISLWVTSQWSTDEMSFNLLTQNPDIYWFQTVMQGDFSSGFYGVHTAGHFTMGGDPSGDIFASPGDPAFWLHHAQIDRTWWIWQNQDIAARQNAISGTITLNNSPPSRNGTLDDVIEQYTLGASTNISSLMSASAGPFCYIYV
ncbi:tyrosinase [Coleophoma crateriformis]|uniref:Tyrosinase n=1 Tax=Coleophoma crateriformis TaxID=565419 RepID=A0A3D8Q7K6_9HELO|nr:tyrosinase [Coleophoma crateriformis]